MLLLAFFILTVVTVPAFGGRLASFAEVRLRHVSTLGVALALQLLITFAIPGSTVAHRVLYIASYALGAIFLWHNRRLPGIWLLAAGGLMNWLAIAANGGIMPASWAAYDAAGLTVPAGSFVNSAPLADPNLAFLGDIFALPNPWPFHNVFSPGDILVALGAAVALHRLCGSRLFPSGAGEFRELRSSRVFMRMWLSQAVSNLGDWIYTIAVASSVARTYGSAKALAVLLVAQVGPAAVTGIVGGPLVDRVSRRGLMIGADVARALSVGSLLLTQDPGLGHIYWVAVCLGVSGALFQPSLQASLPNVVPAERLVAANAMVDLTYNAALMAGPIAGGLLVTQLGSHAAFAVNALSFVLSGALLLGVRLPPRTPVMTRPVRALADGLRYAVSTPLVRGAFIVIGLVMFASAIRSPLEPLFVLRELGLRPAALGLIGGVWGLGMVLGSLSAPAATRAWRGERVLAISIVAVGLTVVTASWTRTLGPLLLLWLFAGFANGAGSVSYESLLQGRVPDAYRGRVMSASQSVLRASLLSGASLAAWLGGHVGVRSTYALSGVLLVLTGLLARPLLSARRHARRRARRPALVG